VLDVRLDQQFRDEEQSAASEEGEASREDSSADGVCGRFHGKARFYINIWCSQVQTAPTCCGLCSGPF